MSLGICVAVASNDDTILASNLLASKMVIEKSVDVRICRDSVSASLAYNQVLKETDADVVVFAHQDVYFPPEWLGQLREAIRNLEKHDPDWAMIAPTGVSTTGEHVGEIWCSGQGTLIGRPVRGAVPVQSVDEAVIVLRRKSEIRFDVSLPGFHFFGTDIVQIARAAKKGAYVCNLPLVHNDAFHGRLGVAFARGHAFIRWKWKDKLPIKTTVLSVQHSGFSWFIYRLRAFLSEKSRSSIAADNRTDPKEFSEKCGWENRPATRLNTRIGITHSATMKTFEPGRQCEQH